MLQQVLEHIHNMFIKEPNPGTYTIAEGRLTLPFLKEGQRFWIVGSDFNDGVYTYHAEGIKNDDDADVVNLIDETFAGTVCSLTVPPAVIELSKEIGVWEGENGDASKSPYQSETVIGVYSYTKARGGTGATETVTWKDVFKTQLDRYRRIAF